ncbi:hypothetical protein DID80_00635 [Candidatus Marinamargulisbacteria bacterium SCGC AAA071-K20]|nr:hypothetical protein DID80_00635 [Candidatus Marinamargulisbacteria bacterium SCGC AAA071-K20]
MQAMGSAGRNISNGVSNLASRFSKLFSSKVDAPDAKPSSPAKSSRFSSIGRAISRVVIALSGGGASSVASTDKSEASPQKQTTPRKDQLTIVSTCSSSAFEALQDIALRGDNKKAEVNVPRYLDGAKDMLNTLTELGSPDASSILDTLTSIDRALNVHGGNSTAIAGDLAYLFQDISSAANELSNPV